MSPLTLLELTFPLWYNTKIFYFNFFSQARLLKWIVDGFCPRMAQSTRYEVRKCLFGVHTMADNILGFKFPQNRQKWPRSSCQERLRDEWFHTRLTSLAWLRRPLAASPSFAERRIHVLFIASCKSPLFVFSNDYNATIVSADALYSLRCDLDLWPFDLENSVFAKFIQYL